MTPPIYTGDMKEATSQEAMMTTQTAKRLTTRITEHVQDKLQAAADLIGATLNQFVVQAAMEKAEKIIESESVVILSRKEALKLLERMENPPPMNDALKALMTEYEGRKVNGSDSTFSWSP
jgi:uncharacterized protein (DUF1778 family)